MKATADASADTTQAKAERRRHIRAVLLAWTFGIALAGIYAVVRDIPAAGWRINDVTTSATPEYPDLQSRIYDSSPENTTVFTAAVATRLPRWKVIRTDTTTHRVQCEVKAPVDFFTDDITVQVSPFGPDNGASKVVIRSHSRAGRADLGQNAQHIRELQSAMDDKLPRLSDE